MRLLSNRRIVVFAILTLALGLAAYSTSRMDYIQFSPDYMAIRTIRQPVIPFTSFAHKAPDDIGEMRRSRLMQWLVDEGFAVVPERNHFRVVWVATSYSAPRKGGKIDCQHFVDMLSDDSWVDWSESNPEVANVLWPAIVSLSRDSYDGIRMAQNLLHRANLYRKQGERKLDPYNHLIASHKLPDEQK